MGLGVSEAENEAKKPRETSRIQPVRGGESFSTATWVIPSIDIVEAFVAQAGFVQPVVEKAERVFFFEIRQSLSGAKMAAAVCTWELSRVPKDGQRRAEGRRG